jgi:predicted NBD/HSP70 family sugar kinase
LNSTRPVSVETRNRVTLAIKELNYRPNAARRALARHKDPGFAPDAWDPGVKFARATTRPLSSAARPPSTDNADQFPHLTTRALLRLVRRSQPISRAEVARRLSLNRSTITMRVKPLLAAGIISETEVAQDPSATVNGRPPVGLSVSSEGRFIVGVNIGVRQTQVRAATIGDDVLCEHTFDTRRDSAETLAHIKALIEGIRREQAGRQLLSIGVSVPGPTCDERKRLLYAPHLDWREVDVAGALLMPYKIGEPSSAHPEVPVVVENDATATALYEMHKRLNGQASDEWRDFILVRAGTGIGVGFVRDGEVHRGTGYGSGIAGEFGHMTIVANGKQCVCGNRGCWERYASASSAAALYKGDRGYQANIPAPRFVEIVARASAGERRAQATLSQVGGYLGIGISNIMVGVGVPRVVVSGRIVQGWEFIRQPLYEAVARTMVGRLSQWSVVAGEPAGTGLNGAVELATDHYLSIVSHH